LEGFRTSREVVPTWKVLGLSRSCAILEGFNFKFLPKKESRHGQLLFQFLFVSSDGQFFD
jgi:hypothetical protein